MVLIVGAVYAGMIRCQRIIPLTFYIVVKRRQFVDFTALRTGCAGIILIQQLDFIVPNITWRCTQYASKMIRGTTNNIILGTAAHGIIKL